ncbi:MAG: DUF2855 family protein [Bacteroidota bacterium]
MSTTTQQQVIVNRSNIHETQVETVAAPDGDSLKAGELILQVEKFGFSANNITYAVVGERVRYWEFFPAKAGWGIVPVWGFAKVVHSNAENVAVGDRFYGYLPMAEYLKVQVGRLNPTGFSDGSPHRAELAPVYNFYVKADLESGFSGASEAVQMIFRPLFTTSFLLDIFLNWNQQFGATQIVLTSASSKTAFALAALLSARQKNKVKVVGLTSTRNLEFVQNMGFYDEVYAYDNVDELNVEPTTIVDFGGNLDLLKGIASQMGDHMKYTCMVGMVDWENWGDPASNGIKGKFFFAPGFIREVSKEWGMEKFQINLAKAWAEFQPHAEKILEIEPMDGLEKARDLYLEMIDGHSSAKKGFTILLE